ncbi:MAG: DUF305 domain-containing protein [Patescibacteria group bacterium]
MIIGAVLLLVGVFIGWLVFANRASWNQMPYNMRSMWGGSMMQNNSMDFAMQGMMMGLSGKTGDDFDRAFLSGMIMHHQGAVVMAEAVLKTSKRSELLKLANDIISAQTKEIEMMQGWQRTWFGE